MLTATASARRCTRKGVAPAPAIPLPNGGWDSRILAFQVERLVTVYGVVTTRYVVLIDTLFSPSALTTVLDALRARAEPDRQLLAVNTHAHWDHAWGNSAFVGPDALWSAPIIGHRRGPDVLLGNNGRAELSRKQAEDASTFAGVRLQPATILIENETVLDGGDLHLVLLPTPGHEPDHLAVFIPEVRTLFTGDAAERPLPFVSNPADLPSFRASLRRMLALDPAIVLYAHAPGQIDPSVLRANLMYFDDLEQRVRAAPSFEQRRDLDPAVVLSYPFDTVLGAEALDTEERTFYLEAHRTAIRAMIDHVQSTA
jgi:glyoxylase-like metal-dependent hydrolase (beta-lactamase superfamily II)